MLHGIGSSKNGRRTSHLVVASFREFISVEPSKPLSGPITSYTEVVGPGCRVTVSAVPQSSHEASSVMENINVELDPDMLCVALTPDTSGPVETRFPASDQPGSPGSPPGVRHGRSFIPRPT